MSCKPGGFYYVLLIILSRTTRPNHVECRLIPSKQVQEIMKCIEVLIIIFILIPGPSKKFQTWFEPQSFKINRTSYCNSLQRPGCANRRTKTGLLMTQVTACERASQWQQALNLLMMCTKPTVVTWLSSVRCQFCMRWKF